MGGMANSCLAALALLASLVVHAVVAAPHVDHASTNNLFTQWLQHHKHNYPAHELDQRQQNFAETLATIRAANRTTAMPNSLAALSIDEFHVLKGLIPLDPTQAIPQQLVKVAEAAPLSSTAPDDWNWCDQGKCTAVKNQGQCGGCWAFATVECIESAYQIEHPDMSVVLSPQELVSCDTNQDGGCNGGNSIIAFDFVKENGLEAEATYPYTSGDTKVSGTCDGDANPVVKCDQMTLLGSGYSEPYSEDQWAGYLYSNSPLSVAIDATDDPWMNYNGGIMECSTATTKINHAVVLVGYGSEDGTDYWTVRNSWGAGWGEEGYARIPRGVGCYMLTTQTPVYFSGTSSTGTPVPSPTPVPPPASCSDLVNATCGSCIGESGCGWCSSDSACVPGSSSEASGTSSSCAYGSGGWDYASCPSPSPAGGDSQKYSLTVLIILASATLVVGLIVGCIIMRCLYQRKACKDVLLVNNYARAARRQPVQPVTFQPAQADTYQILPPPPPPPPPRT